MRLIKYSHACVRLEDGERVLTIDPGVWAEPASVAGTDAVLITHEHFDHLNIDLLADALAANPTLKVFAHPDVTAQLDVLGEAAVPVRVNDSFTAGGFPVRAVGGRHADIYDGLPGCANLGYVVADAIYHPGDSLFAPAQAIEHLLVPISGPWLHLAAAIDFVREVAPAHAYPIHDMLLSEIGHQSAGRWLESKGEAPYTVIPVGEAVEV